MPSEAQQLTARVRAMSKEIGGDFHAAVFFTAAGIDAKAAKEIHGTEFGKRAIEYDPSAELSGQEVCRLLTTSSGNWSAMVSMGEAPKPDGSRGTFRTWKIGTLLSAVVNASDHEPVDQFGRLAWRLTAPAGK